MLNTKLFDHTILKADATEAQVAKICKEALENDFASVCVNQYYTKFVAEQLKGSDVKVCTVVGFPLGMSDTRVKAFETKAAIEDGATEVDMVINVGALKDKKYDYVLNDIKTLKEVCGKDIVLKVIIETCLLTDEEKVKACELSKEAGADFVKTSTGFSTAGAKASDVALMRKTVGEGMGVKASGGIHTSEEALEMVEAGANRLGTSATLAIIGK
ncbi:MAG: deoxyribose-phosphate aldolase [Roseburia sp.]|uniref:deoxyribose-phosphate aldolase n=1 Tax=Roseburia sp. 831b TaxID=1261635 RepID=UPI0009521AAE|nr:deoxyribose-phosphate aldolase [Roseburia sp. 831b]MCI5918005.1 deoxyribose-phosphate aldolase [Roseburia sp.]MDD6216557.1 deoxyribose-phosphate aldolase [Roseburia sp.]MDY5881742.1 deoxyribose-phosphate aldolase [Roseburia sp.]WVK74114.1 deoxyribose-phosphate aldolase [Roseburia sp. 831b]